MNSYPSVLFVDRSSSFINDLFPALENNFPNSFYHAKSQNDIIDNLRLNDPDILFIDIGSDNNERDLLLIKKLSDSGSKLIIGVIPEGDEYLTAKVIECNLFFYINKPYDLDEIRIVLKRANEKINYITFPEEREIQDKFSGIIGKSPQMLALFDLITRVADDDFSTVLIRGESGTGKELVAKAIHSRSRRNSKNFVPVNCAAIPDELLESELFGHTKGAFTGATQNKQGRIQYADGGTLFLDEIGDMKPSLQAKLLRVLQEKEFEPVGGLQAIPVDTRILAATHCDLEQLVEEGKFREDLYYRLSVIPLQIPPLKARRQDIPLLIESFIETYTIDRGRPKFDFSSQAIEALLKYNWKGNVRELENLVQHMSILFSGKTVTYEDLPEKYLMRENQCDEDITDITCSTSRESAENELLEAISSLDKFHFYEGEVDFKEMINQYETELIVKALRTTGGNKKEAARLLKLKRTTLLEKIKKKKLSPENW